LNSAHVIDAHGRAFPVDSANSRVVWSRPLKALTGILAKYPCFEAIRPG
jgi:hypothetical protein